MKYLKIWTDLRNNLTPFGDAEKGRLFDAMMKYAESGIDPDLRGNERFIWGTVKAEIDRQRDAYEKKCQQNRINGASRSQSLPVAANGSESQQEYKTEEKEKKKEKTKKESQPRYFLTLDECSALINSFTESRAVREAAMGWVRMRYAKKGDHRCTERALTSALEKVRGMAKSEDAAVAVFAQSEERCWDGLFEVQA